MFILGAELKAPAISDGLILMLGHETPRTA